jgi:hypothetical protein
MKRIFKTKAIVAILSVFILTVSIYLVAASPYQILDKCNKVCEKYLDLGPTPWMICMDGCLHTHVQ